MDLEKCLNKAKLDESAFKEIYDLTINRLFSFVLLRIRDKSEALDVVQDIYLSLWKSLDNFIYISEPHFYAFLFKVARRQLIKARAKIKDTVEFDEIFDIPVEGDEREDYRVLLSQIKRLNIKEQVCIELRYFEDLKFKNIAEILNTTESNTKVLHHRAIKKLKELMNDYE